MKQLFTLGLLLVTFSTQAQEFTFTANNVFIHDYNVQSEKTLAEDVEITYDGTTITIVSYGLIPVNGQPSMMECYRVWHENIIPRSLGRFAVFLYAGDTEEQCTEQFRVEWRDGQVLSVTHVTKRSVEDEPAVVRLYEILTKETDIKQ